MVIFYVNILSCSILFLFSVYYSKLVNCLYNYSINNNFLHLNDVSSVCLKESVDSYPYGEALTKCALDLNCVYVKADEYDVYNETHGNSKLCYSSNLSTLYPINNGRVSIKVDKLLGDLGHLYNIKSNRKGICKSSQIVGQLEPVSSYSEAARECQRLNCDYFTIGFFKDNNQNIFDTNTVTKTNGAQFCVGDPLGLYSEGYLMAERVHTK